MDADLNGLIARWQLPEEQAKRLCALSRTQLRACRDIDAALALLLGDATQIPSWLQRPQAPLLHARPVDMVLTTPTGCEVLRAILLRELVASGETSVAAAALGSAP